MKGRGLKGHKDHGKSLPQVEKGSTGTRDAILLTHLALLPPSALLSPLASITPFHAIRFRATLTRQADKVEILDPSTFPPLESSHGPAPLPSSGCTEYFLLLYLYSSPISTNIQSFRISF